MRCIINIALTTGAATVKEKDKKKKQSKTIKENSY